MQRVFTIIALVLMSTAIWAAKLPSETPTADVIIDGNSQDWISHLYEIQGKDLTVGVMNDSSWLYICLFPTSRKVSQQFIDMGYTLWINQYGKKREELGIRFPGVMAAMNQQHGFGGMHPEQSDETRKIPPSVRLPEYVTIIRDETETRVKQDEALGFSWAAVNNEGVPVYEFRIPLTHNNIYTISCDAEGGKTIALGIKGTTARSPEGEAQREHRMEANGDGPNGGGPRSSGRPGENFGGPSTPASASEHGIINFWLKVKLTK